MGQESNHLNRDLVVALLITLGIALQVVTKPWVSPMRWDAFGYYLYLPLAFIHNDLGMKDPETIEGIFEEYQPSDTFYQVHKAPTGSTVIRYTPGLAVLNLPGFVLAHAMAVPLGYPRDGLSKPYQVSAFLTLMFCLFLGSMFLMRFLHLLFDPLVVYASVVLIIFGTNAMDQLVDQQLMTHNYSFMGYAILLWTTHRLHLRPTIKRALAVGSVLGLMIIIRPTNGLALLIPILWPLPEHPWLKKWQVLFQQYRLELLALIGSMLLVVSILLLYWKVYGGSFVYDSYQNPGEGLDVFYPHLHWFLFSFRKGWFIYTPLMILAVIGLSRLYKTNRALAKPLIIFLAVFLFVVSSWTLWWYPGGLGQRSAVDIYPVMAVGLAAALTWLSRCSFLWKFAASSFIGACVLLNFHQTMQLRNFILEPDRMTRQYYLASFFDTAIDPDKKDLLLFKRPSVANAPFENRDEYEIHGEWIQDLPEDELMMAPDGSRAWLLDQDHAFTPSLSVEFRELTDGDHAWVEVTGNVFFQDDPSSSEISIVTTMDHNGNYGYTANDLHRIDGITAGGWRSFSIQYLTPDARRPWDMLRVYSWFRTGSPVWIKDIQVRSYTRRSER